MDSTEEQVNQNKIADYLKQRAAEQAIKKAERRAATLAEREQLAKEKREFIRAEKEAYAAEKKAKKEAEKALTKGPKMTFEQAIKAMTSRLLQTYLANENSIPTEVRENEAFQMAIVSTFAKQLLGMSHPGNPQGVDKGIEELVTQLRNKNL